MLLQELRPCPPAREGGFLASGPKKKGKNIGPGLPQKTILWGAIQEKIPAHARAQARYKILSRSNVLAKQILENGETPSVLFKICD